MDDGGTIMTTILIVTGASDSISAWNCLLCQDGYRVVSAHNGLEGLVVARKERPALIITDRSMPVMDGVEFRRHLRLKRAFARIPLILASAEPLGPQERGGWDDVWPKPVSVETIRGSVQFLLNARQRAV
jgi:CheY-like chemotaxis protein